MSANIHLWFLKVSNRRYFSVFEPSLVATNPKGVLMPYPMGVEYCQELLMHGRDLVPVINYGVPSEYLENSHVALCKAGEQFVAFRVMSLPQKLNISDAHSDGFKLDSKLPWSRAVVSGFKYQSHNIAIIDPERITRVLTQSIE